MKAARPGFDAVPQGGLDADTIQDTIRVWHDNGKSISMADLWSLIDDSHLGIADVSTIGTDPDDDGSTGTTDANDSKPSPTRPEPILGGDGYDASEDRPPTIDADISLLASTWFADPDLTRASLRQALHATHPRFIPIGNCTIKVIRFIYEEAVKSQVDITWRFIIGLLDMITTLPNSMVRNPNVSDNDFWDYVVEHVNEGRGFTRMELEKLVATQYPSATVHMGNLPDDILSYYVTRHILLIDDNVNHKEDFALVLAELLDATITSQDTGTIREYINAQPPLPALHIPEPTGDAARAQGVPSSVHLQTPGKTISFLNTPHVLGSTKDAASPTPAPNISTTPVSTKTAASPTPAPNIDDAASKSASQTQTGPPSSLKKGKFSPPPKVDPKNKLSKNTQQTTASQNKKAGSIPPNRYGYAMPQIPKMPATTVPRISTQTASNFLQRGIQNILRGRGRLRTPPPNPGTGSTKTPGDQNGGQPPSDPPGDQNGGPPQNPPPGNQQGGSGGPPGDPGPPPGPAPGDPRTPELLHILTVVLQKDLHDPLPQALWNDGTHHHGDFLAMREEHTERLWYYDQDANGRQYQAYLMRGEARIIIIVQMAYRYWRDQGTFTNWFNVTAAHFREFRSDILPDLEGARPSAPPSTPAAHSRHSGFGASTHATSSTSLSKAEQF